MSSRRYRYRRDEGELRIVNAGEPRLFEIDYFDDNDKPADLGLFVETRMRLEPDSVECTAVLYLWPTRTDQVKICGQFPGTVVYTLKEALTELKMLFRVNEKATGQKRFGFRADMVIS